MPNAVAPLTAPAGQPKLILADASCEAAAKPLSRLSYLTDRRTPQAESQMPEVFDKAYDAELNCAVSVAHTYLTNPSLESLRAALLAKLRLALLLTWSAEHDMRQGNLQGAHETLLEALDISRFTYDATSSDRELTGIHSAAETVDDEVLSGLEELRRANPRLVLDSGSDEVEDVSRVVHAQNETRVVEAFLDQWERRSKHKTFDGAEVIETVDGSTTVEVRTDRESWLSRSVEARRSTFSAVLTGVAPLVTSGALGFVLKFVDSDGATLVASRVPRNLVDIPF